MDQVDRPVTAVASPAGRPRQIWFIVAAALVQAIVLAAAGAVLLLQPERLPAFGLAGTPGRGVVFEGWFTLLVAATLAIGAFQLPRRRIGALVLAVPLALVVLPFLWIKLYPVHGPVVLGWSATFALLPLVIVVVAAREPARGWMLPPAPAQADPGGESTDPPISPNS